MFKFDVFWLKIVHQNKITWRNLKSDLFFRVWWFQRFKGWVGFKGIFWFHQNSNELVTCSFCLLVLGPRQTGWMVVSLQGWLLQVLKKVLLVYFETVSLFVHQGSPKHSRKPPPPRCIFRGVDLWSLSSLPPFRLRRLSSRDSFLRLTAWKASESKQNPQTRLLL